MSDMSNLARRDFMKGAAALMAQPGERVGVAAVGVGTRGFQLLREAQAVADTEIRVICDLYEGNLKRAKEFTTNQKVRLVKEWERAVEDKDVDVVLIATPDFYRACRYCAFASICPYTATGEPEVEE